MRLWVMGGLREAVREGSTVWGELESCKVEMVESLHIVRKPN